MHRIRNAANRIVEPSAGGADSRDAIAGVVTGFVLLVNGFADRIGYAPLTGTETAGIIGAVWSAVLVWRKLAQRRAR